MKETERAKALSANKETEKRYNLTNGYDKD